MFLPVARADGPLMARKTGNRPGTIKIQTGDIVSDLGFHVERVTGIEPALSAWEADVLPLNYTRTAPGPDRPTARPDIVPEPSTPKAATPGTPARDGRV
jgi:hypothetical protein